MEDKEWHAIDISEVFNKIGSRPEGLTDEQARRQMEQYGPNRLPSSASRGPLARFLSQFNNLLIYVLLASATVTALMAHWVDSGVIFGVVLINAVIGLFRKAKPRKPWNPSGTC